MSPCRLHENLIFRKIRGKDDVLVSGNRHRFQSNPQGSGGSAGHIEIVRTEISLKSAVQIIGDRLSHFQITLCGGIAEQVHIVTGIQQFLEHLMHLFRRRNIGISKAEIKYVLRADFRRTLFAVLENLPDHRPVLSQFCHFL